MILVQQVSDGLCGVVVKALHQGDRHIARFDYSSRWGLASVISLIL